MLNKIISAIKLQTIFILIAILALGVLVATKDYSPEIIVDTQDFKVIAEEEYVAHSFKNDSIQITYSYLDEEKVIDIPVSNFAFKYSEARTQYVQILTNSFQDTIVNILIPIEHVSPIE